MSCGSGLVSDDVIVGLDNGVVGLMEGDGIIGAYSAGAFYGGGEFDNIVEGRRRVYGE